MVGLVIVSHSEKLAQGVAELVRMMTAETPLAIAGGLEDGSLGTSFERISAAVDAVYSDDGVLLLMDMGSAVMTAEMVLESMPDRKLRMLDCPVVEGAVAAAMNSVAGMTIDEIAEQAGNWSDYSKIT